jgi:cytochrome c553
MRKLGIHLLLPLVAAACAAGNTAKGSSAEVPPASTGAEAAPMARHARGGRLFDDWAKATGTAFRPDDPRTPALDGEGGPFGNGTLPDHAGRPMPNTGHDYRLARLLGRDLRGASGAQETCASGETGRLVPALLADTDTEAQWLSRMRDGEDGIPAYGTVLDDAALHDLVGFLLAVRDGRLPSPSALVAPSTGTRCGFELTARGDPERGQRLHAAQCASCHGDDGRSLALGGSARLSLGDFVRNRAPEAWYVMLSGKAGTTMKGLLESPIEPAVLGSALADLFAAYGEPQRFPAP